MGLFTKKAPVVSADGYQRKALQGYADKGPVAKALAEGWEIESVSPVSLGGTSLKQSLFMLRRKPPMS